MFFRLKKWVELYRWVLSDDRKQLIDKLNWSVLSVNPKAVGLLLENKDKIDLSRFSINPGAVDFLKLSENRHLIDWDELCKNTNPKAIMLIQQNIARAN